MNDNEPPNVWIILGAGRREKDGAEERLNILLTAPDEDSAVRRALEALAQEGYAEVDLDQIGEIEGEPEEEPHISAWQGAIEGEVSIIRFG